MLSRIHRLSKKDIVPVLKTGRTIRGRLISLRYMRTRHPESRAAFVVGTAVSKRTTIRNRLRRRLSELMRLEYFPILPVSYDLVIRVFPEAKDMSFKETKEELSALFKKSGLVR